MRTTNQRAASPTAVPCHANNRAPFPILIPTPQALSLNVFYESRKSNARSLTRSNCRSIEVVVLHPLYAASSPISEDEVLSPVYKLPPVNELAFTEGLLEAANMFVDQVPEDTTSLSSETFTDSFTQPTTLSQSSKESGTRFFDLPLELRLKIYGYLLPSRTHAIVTQIPYNGYFYNTSTIPVNSATSFYPFGRTGPTAQKHGYTTYKVLTTNQQANSPAESIYPEILRVNKQILAEAEPVLYGSNEANWDFGVHLDALLSFWSDRSEVARKGVRNLRIASQLPLHDAPGKGQEISALWIKTCAFITTEMTSLRNLDLTMWSSYYAQALVPVSSPLEATILGETMEQPVTELQMQDWGCVAGLLQMSALRKARLTCWAFQENQKAAEEMVGNSNFGNWIAGRMVGDKTVRERMVGDRVVDERVVVWKA